MHMNQRILKISKIHINKISDAYKLQCVRRIGVLVLVPKDLSAFSEAIVSRKVKEIILYQEYEDQEQC